MNGFGKRMLGCCLCMLMGLPSLAENGLTERLVKLGMENVSWKQTNDTLTVAYEDRVYRGTYRGMGEVIVAALQHEAENIEFIIKENGIPQICITLPKGLVNSYQQGACSLGDVYRQMGISIETDAAVQRLKGAVKPCNRSARRLDLVIYPQVFLENNTFDELYTYAVNLNPALEMQLWKGAKLTAQVVLPVVTNLHGEKERIRPGVVALQQEFRWKHNWLSKVAVGNFTNNRYGVQVETGYLGRNGLWSVFGKAGMTGHSEVTRDDGLQFMKRKRWNAALRGTYYITRWNLQTELQAARYVYGDLGVRADVTRHFGEVAVGFYGMFCDDELNAGFHVAIPLPGKKWKRPGWMRVKPAEFFSWEYGLVAHGKFYEERMGWDYSAVPADNRSERFYQPDYIRYFLIKDWERKVQKQFRKKEIISNN